MSPHLYSAWEPVTELPLLQPEPGPEGWPTQCPGGGAPSTCQTSPPCSAPTSPSTSPGRESWGRECSWTWIGPHCHPKHHLAGMAARLSAAGAYGKGLLSLGGLEERESKDNSTFPGLHTLSLSSRQARQSSPSPWAFLLQFAMLSAVMQKLSYFPTICGYFLAIFGYIWLILAISG